MSRSVLISRLASGPPWVAVAVIVLAILAASLVYLWPAPLEFPMDDTYIHFVYAENLAEQGKLMLNSAGEKGVGTTSILWVLLLAGGHALGLPMHALAKVLGMLALSTLGATLYLLLRSIWHPLLALAGPLLVAVSGNLLWFALSGMETLLFVALGVLALPVYRQERWVWLGLVLGLLGLARPGGVFLAAVIGGVELWRHRGIRRGILVTALVCALICGPWYGYLLWRTGNLLPTSAMGKMFSFSIATRVVTAGSGALAALGRCSPFTYTALSASCVLEFALGGMALPPPRIPIGGIVGNPNYTVSLWAILGWIGVVVPLAVAAGRRVGALRRWGQWLRDPARRPLLCFILWTLFHNLIYSLFVPVPGTACRYGPMNYVALWLALALGLHSLAGRPRLRLWLAAGLAVLGVSNTAYWNGVYDANIEHMERVRIPAAHHARDSLAPGQLCAVFDIGAYRYYSQLPVLDLGGLVDPDAGRWFLEGQCDRYIVESGATCLVLPGRTGTSDEGWFDMAAILGLTTSPLFEMNEVAVFEIDHDRWLLGYLPTNNYQATVTIYHLEPTADLAVE